uniref:Uncharacterized protein AlNc14C38G3311 n=1 Tax=Albugo laibachii Nc14 TaxID=890382 RepID=F0W945_9STRA|nr:conserved hypothetical protein [Albugo laibachii Nc14]|eukprot:CCA17657.1 conserved hypothetical protein [Albugo laibachii Nc14]
MRIPSASRNLEPLKIELKRKTRQLKNQTSPPLVYNDAPLGVGLGTHYAELYIGIPPQRASVILDTGSGLTAFPCDKCVDCGTHTDPKFDATKSTSINFVQCKYEEGCDTCRDNLCVIHQRYSEGSMWEAVVMQDLIWVGNVDSDRAEMIMRRYGIRFKFGCQTRETGLFITQVENGIMGLGIGRNNIATEMYKAKRVEEHKFALCFGQKGGSFVIGGVDYSHHTTKIAYTPLAKHGTSNYPIEVKDVRIGGISLQVDAEHFKSGRGAIVDSGTTDTYFPSAAATPFQEAFKRITGVEYNENKMNLTPEMVETLPNVSLIIAGEDGEDFEISLNASDYILNDSNHHFFGTLHFSERRGAVLGASIMMGYDVIFDLEKKRVGFAEATCDGKGHPITLPLKPLAPIAKDVSSNTNSLVNVKNASHTYLMVPVIIIGIIGLIIAGILWKGKSRSTWKALTTEQTMSDSENDEDLVESKQPESADRALRPITRSAITLRAFSPMKFGKVLQKATQMSSSEWESHWVDYKVLKRIIKDCAQLSTKEKLRSKQGQKVARLVRVDNDTIRQSPDEMNFFRTLRVEIKKIATFFVKEQAKFTGQIGALEAQFQQLKTSPSASIQMELMKSCVNVYKDLLLLENFAVMNFCGISKILKKHDKWTGYATRHKFMHTILMKQPFATYCPLLKMINRLEQIFMEATGCSIDEHDSQKCKKEELLKRAKTESVQESEISADSNLTSDKHSKENDGNAVKTDAEKRQCHVERDRDSTHSEENSVSLDQVHALRDDVWQLKILESDAYDQEEDVESQHDLPLPEIEEEEESKKSELEGNDEDGKEQVTDDEACSVDESNVGVTDSDNNGVRKASVKQAKGKMSVSTILN